MKEIEDQSSIVKYVPFLFVFFLLAAPIAFFGSNQKSVINYSDANICSCTSIGCNKQPHNILKLFQNTDSTFHDIPVYMNHDINEGSSSLEHAFIIQHGNLRNSIDYFCASINALSSPIVNMSSVLLLSTQFLVDNDTCWQSSEIKTVSFENHVSCGFPIWSGDGWKDGHLSRTRPGLFSYNVYNMLVNLLGNQTYFPNLKTITLFGFSAGGQVLLRYAAMPFYELNNPKVNVRFVISDPSTYLYFDKQRPFNNGTIGFGVPDKEWENMWKYRFSTFNISSWSSECEQYNHWRYGFERLNGYAEYHALRDPYFIMNTILGFESRDITYLLGTADDVNCKLNNTAHCDDHELATYCQAMLQGSDRVDRMLKWKIYLKHIYGHDVHRLVKADGIHHDPVAMINSKEGKCTIFGICNESSANFPKFSFDP